MRKQTKLVAVLSAAALLAIGASMTSMAAGWTQEDGEWVYLNSDGERATETWKRSGDYYYWFDENGDIAKNQIIENNENYYYVNEDGVRVCNQWVAVENDDEVYVDNKEVSVLWYYLGPTGRAYKAADANMYKNAVIDGSRFLFDEYGHMVSGWVNTEDEDTYYLGDENQGWAHTGWQYLEIPEDIESNYDVDEAWFYFGSNGKAKKETRSYITNAYYAFDEYGVMLDDWQDSTSVRVSSAGKIGLATNNKAFYNIEVGNQGTGWVHTYAEEEEGGDVKWFYMESANKGTVFNAYGKDSNYPNMSNPPQYYHKYVDGNVLDSSMAQLAAKVIKGKTYIFNNRGEMQTGVFVFDRNVKMGNGELPAGVYYFDKTGGSVEGRMLTSRRVGVTYDDGETYTYYFTKAGEAARLEVNNGSLYDGYGVRVEAKDGNPNQLVDIEELLDSQPYDETAPGKLYKTAVKLGDKYYDHGTVIVSSTGKIRTGKVTIDDVIYTVENYVVTRAVDKNADKEERDTQDLTDRYKETDALSAVPACWK